MADATIDSLKITIRTDADRAKREINDLTGAIKQLGGSANGSGLKNAGDRLTNLTNAVNKINSNGIKALEFLAESMSDVSSNKGFTPFINSINKLNEVISKLDISKYREFAEVLQQIRNAVGQGFNIRISTGAAKKPEEATQGSAEGATASDVAMAEAPSAMASVSSAIAETQSRLEGLGHTFAAIIPIVARATWTVSRFAAQGLGYVAKQMLHIATTPFRAIKKVFSGITTGFGNLLRMFKKRAMYRLLNSIISAITNGIKEGMQNLYHFSELTGTQFAKSMDTLTTSMLYLKNSLGAMVEPLINYLAPIIDSLIDKFVEFINVINRTIATLTGASTWTRALKFPKSYGDTLSEANKKAKELKATILGIDEINLMNGLNNNGGSGSYSDEDYLSMFTTESLKNTSTIEGTFRKISGLAADILSTLEKVWKSSAMEKFKSGVTTAFEGIKKLTGGIFEDFKKIWSSGTGQKLLENFLSMCGSISEAVGLILGGFGDIWKENSENGTGIIQTICDIVANIYGFVDGLASSFNKAWKEVNGKETILQPIYDIVKGVLGFVNDITKGFQEWISEVDLAPLLKATGDLLTNMGDLAKTIGGVFKTAWNTVLKPALTFLMKEGLPTAIEDVAAALSILNGALSLFDENKTPEMKFKDFAKGIVDGLSAAYNTIMVAANAFMNGIIDLLNATNQLTGGTSMIPHTQTPDKVDFWKDWGLDTVMAEYSGDYSGISKYRTQPRTTYGFSSSIDSALEEQWYKDIFSKLGKADGGMVNQGTMFVAGERGAEIVANVGNRTGVMNVGQLSAGVAEGVMEANASQNALLREQNSLLRALLDKDVVAQISTDSLVDGIARKNRRDGRTVIPVGV